jgi:hypothetical protein
MDQVLLMERLINEMNEPCVNWGLDIGGRKKWKKEMMKN